ncbi:glycoside hydrolase family 78 protein [Parachryseolinea silvisoli]|uniref:glycoside hydrolase family 78 protein n=1 Tax=Parachryseolinea silvisoli TaxID=2873601 RepID=UPI002265A696|nr:glycoside hydrolase family 78 protein [Parachryseolinea silvisoli]MCD9014978.1 glycoside hydrolase family 78 protein [Parachryseolinea silvisoli]
MTRLIFFLCLLATATQAQKLAITTPTCEYQHNPLGLDAPTPRFSWVLTTTRRNVLQTGYELVVSRDAGFRDVIWKTGRVKSDQSVLVSYRGPALTAGEKYHWRVRVWDNGGNASAWSTTQSFEMGLLQPGDWTAAWIEPDLPGDAVNKPAPMMRREFTLGKPVATARLYITAHGLYEAHINGQRVGDAYLTPGWTSYNKRLQYQVYDVTPLLKTGVNATGVLLGDGWYRGNLAWADTKNIYGSTLGLLYELRVTYTDGTRQVITSDKQWKSNTGPIVRAGIYYGEAYDARLEKTGWTQTGYTDAGWQGVKVAEGGKDNLVATCGPPVRKHETFRAQKILHTPKGETVVDFGQNLVGWITLKVSGKAGDRITIRHAEVLDREGNFYTDNLRAAQAEVVYTLKGGGQEVYEPRFSFFGFRYIKVEGYPGTLTTENISATALYSDMPSTGSFSTSHPLINQLQHNIRWGQNGNFVDVPTDCPQRDERLGWTGDAQVFARTAAFNRQVAGFFNKWMHDVAADQQADGRIPFVIPNVLGPNDAASTGWADVVTIIPWTMYQAYGDTTFLRQQYPSMKAWVDYMERNSQHDLWNTGFHFGDWLFYRPFDDNDGTSAVTDKYLIAQCFRANSVQLMINAATILGRQDDAQAYSSQLKKIKDAFLREYATPSGRLVSGTQTAYVLALQFDMLPENLRAQAADRLVANVRQYGNHLTTGFLGTPYLCHVLSQTGHTDVAYDLLLQETYPSWLYPVKMGATTIWERWDGQRPDGTFQTPGMNSFNHYAYGAIGDWMYRRITGIRNAAPGYKHITIAPEPGGNVQQAAAELVTPHGIVSSAWKKAGAAFTLDVTIPANTTAEVVLPGAAGKKVIETRTALEQTGFAQKTAGSDITVTLGSGTYHFQYE